MKINRAKLPNGLRVLTIPRHDTQAVTVFVFTKVGSRYETKPINGVSHFIEHLMFKGTAKRPTTLEISKLLDGVGASFNAFTSKDSTGYYVKVNAAHTELAVDIVSDMLQYSKFDPAEIARERGVIIEEIKMYDENPLMTIEDLFETALYGGHHQLGWNIAGPPSVIRRITRREMLKYRDRYYHAGNMWVVVAGKITPSLNRLIYKYFSTVRRKSSTPAYIPYRPGTKHEPVVIKHKDLEQAQVGLGTRAYSYTDKRLPALSVLSVILGGNMSSRLFIQVRERRGLAYSVSSSINPYQDTGSFMIHAGLKKERLAEALTVIVEELKKLKSQPVSAAELSRSKEFLRGKSVLGLEDSETVAAYYGRQALFSKKIISPEQMLKLIDRVTAKDIQRVANDLFQPANMRLALIGPFNNHQQLANIIKKV